MRVIYPNELYHYGILGMKWGIRRYQPYSEKPRLSGKGGKEIGEARKHRRRNAAIAIGATAATAAGTAAAIKAAKKNPGYFDQTIKDGKDKPNVSPAEKAIKGSQKAVESASDATRALSRIQKRSKPSLAKTMSDDELRTRIQRMELERRYDSLSSEDLSSGFDYATDILSVIGGVVGVAGGAASIYAVLKMASKAV